MFVNGVSTILIRSIAIALGLMLTCSTALAQVTTLYAASGSNGVGGSLYTVNPATGAATVVGPLVDSVGNPYGMSGMVWDASTSTLYGSTNFGSPTGAGSLVTIDRNTGLVTVIGAIPAGAMADITIQPGTGTLFGWQSAGTHSLFTIDKATGASTAVGAPLGTGVFGGGGLSFNGTSTGLYSAPAGSQTHDLRSVDPVTGVHTVIGILNGFAPAVVAMDFNSGQMYGLFSDRSSSPTTTHLEIINLSTAGVTDIGVTSGAGDLDAMAFVTTSVPEPTSLALVGCAFAGVAWVRRRKTRQTAAT
jgi:PEP-CTERM motif-containing protein